VFTARYALSPCIKQIESFVLKGLSTSLMVTVAIKALKLEYLVKILD
jgi:hypothetical protein